MGAPADYQNHIADMWKVTAFAANNDYTTLFANTRIAVGVALFLAYLVHYLTQAYHHFG